MTKMSLSCVAIVAAALAGCALGACVPSSASASSAGSCREYLEARDAKNSASLLHEQRRDQTSAELANAAAERWRGAREAVISSLKAGGDKMLGQILASWERARDESEKASAATLLWILLDTGRESSERASPEFVTIADAMDAVHVAEHATITLACRLRERTQP